MKLLIYQVLPRLSGNKNACPVINGSIEENGCGKLSDFTPAVLKSIRQIGFNCIWYTGLLEHATQTGYPAYSIRKDHSAIVKGKAGSPYAVKDYYDIDPDLADDVNQRMAEFEALVKRTRRAGLKMVIDFIPNHVAREYHSDAKPEGVEDLGASDNVQKAFDPGNNFYYIPGSDFDPHFPLTGKEGDIYTETPAKATGNDCFSPRPNRNDWYETVKLNYGVDYLNHCQTHFSPIPDTWKKILDILLFWADKKIDGFRCDMAEMTPVEFWAYAIPQVKKKHPDILFIAEVYNPEQYRNYLNQGHFDYLYDKVGLYDTLRAVICGYQPAEAISGCWQAVEGIQSKMLNFLENHDEQRIASDFFAGNAEKGRPALVVSATMNTNPFMVYFGQEWGERGMDTEGFSGCDGRTTIFDYWSLPAIRNGLSDKQIELRDYYSKVLQLCNQSKAIREGKFFDLMYVNRRRAGFNPAKQYAYMRAADGEYLLIVANFDEIPVQVNVFIPAHAFEYLEIPEKCVPDLPKDGFYPVEIPAWDAAIIRFQRSE